jgi:hypothetical protein
MQFYARILANSSEYGLFFRKDEESMLQHKQDSHLTIGNTYQRRASL